MEKFESIREKIKKLLSLADKNKNTSQEEAESALQKAQALMRKYNIQEEEVNGKSASDIIREIYPTGYRSLRSRTMAIMQILKSCFMVEPIYFDGYNMSRSEGEKFFEMDKGRKPSKEELDEYITASREEIHIALVGRKHNIDIAYGVWQFLIYELERRIKIARKEMGKVKRKSFCFGFAQGIINKLKEEEKQQKQTTQDKWEMVVVGEKDLIANWMQENMPNVRYSSARSRKIDQEHVAAGKKHGSQVNIRNQVN